MIMIKIGENYWIDSSKIVTARALRRKDYSRYKTKHWWTGKEYYTRKEYYTNHKWCYVEDAQLVIWTVGPDDPIRIKYDFFDGFLAAKKMAETIVEIINMEKKNASSKTCGCNTTTD